MSAWETVKGWFKRNKKKVIIGGSAVLMFIGAGIGYVLCQNGKVSFSDWLKIASKEELNEAYEKLLPIFRKTGTKPFEMEQISQELGARGAKEWFEKHPPNLDPNFRWTDAARWDKD
jgi:hypothetical protein